ncbi:MAG TPA: hypothetical protein VM183_16540, partial [Burkholderiales bacterium]|nr:hypothetical protein [Burkholderiales bacterium]
IGITPFLSMLRDARHRRLAHRFMLLYCNRRPETAAFLEELQALEKVHLNFRLVCALDADGAEHLEQTRMRGHLAGLANPVCYFTGRPSTTLAVRAMLSGSACRRTRCARKISTATDPGNARPPRVIE